MNLSAESTSPITLTLTGFQTFSNDGVQDSLLPRVRVQVLNELEINVQMGDVLKEPISSGWLRETKSNAGTIHNHFNQGSRIGRQKTALTALMNLNNFIVLYKEPWLFEYGKQCDALAQERPPAPKIGCTPWIDMHEVICVRLRP